MGGLLNSYPDSFDLYPRWPPLPKNKELRRDPTDMECLIKKISETD